VARVLGDMGRARRAVACTGFAGASGFLLLSTTMPDPLYAVLAIGMASFCNDLAMPATWSAVMDVGGKYAGTLAGAMNMWGNIGGALCPLAIGYMLAWTGSWTLTFYVSAAVYLTGVVFWALLDPVTPLDREEAVVQAS
jgi:MFS transporter, ACS family, glucarate transporter